MTDQPALFKPDATCSLCIAGDRAHRVHDRKAWSQPGYHTDFAGAIATVTRHNVVREAIASAELDRDQTHSIDDGCPGGHRGDDIQDGDA